MSSKKGFLSTLMGRSLVLWVLPSVLVFAVVFTINAVNELSIAKESIKKALTLQVDKISEDIESDNMEALQTAKTMAIAQQNGLLGQRIASYNFAKAVLTGNPQFTGSYIGYEPNIDGNDAISRNDLVLSKGGQDEEGRFLPYWYRDGDKLNVITMTDMNTSPYYAGAKSLFESSGKQQGLITEPYNLDGTLIVEQVYPIVMNDKFIGIAGIDRALNYITDKLNTLKSETGHDYYLLSHERNFIAATSQKDILTKSFSDTVYKKVFEDLQKNDNYVMENSIGENGESRFFVGSNVKVGDWLLIQSTATSQILAPLYQNIYQTLGLGFLAILIVIAISLYFAQSISKRARGALERANKVRAGDIESLENISITKKVDEIDEMLEAINGVVNSYKGINRVCKAIAGGDFDSKLEPQSDHDIVATALNDMSAKRKQIDLELRERAQRILSTTTKQSSKIESVSHAISEMNSSIGEVSQLASTAADNAKGSVDAVSDVKQLLGNAVEQATLLSKEISQTSEAVSKVSQSSDDINQIIDVINAIAEQTNLLALNAAIEAARAGEQGRGFAVVADEVRNLAAKTQQSTEEIRTLINQLGANVKSSVTLVSQGLERANSSVEIAQKSDQSLSTVAEQIAQISDNMMQVAAAVEQQSSTTREISDNMRIIQETAQELSQTNPKD